MKFFLQDLRHHLHAVQRHVVEEGGVQEITGMGRDALRKGKLNGRIIGIHAVGRDNHAAL